MESCLFASFFLSFLTTSFQEAVSSLSLNGFLNYFGPQRFGLDDREVNACDIGLAMLQGNMVRDCLVGYSCMDTWTQLPAAVREEELAVTIQTSLFGEERISDPREWLKSSLTDTLVSQFYRRIFADVIVYILPH